MFTPFAFVKSTAVVPPPITWTPADLSNLHVWFRADTGITTSGTNVTSWASKAGASLTLSQAAGATDSVYNSADSSFNNEPTVTFPSNLNGCLTLGTVTSSGLTQTTAVCFIFSPLGLPAGGYQLLGGLTSTGGSGGEIVPGPSTNAFPNEYSAYTFNGGQKTSGVASSNGGKQFMIADFSNSDNNLIFYPNSTTGVTTGTSVNTLENVRYSIGGYGQPGGFASGIGFNGKIMEMIITTGTRWTAQDVSDLASYVSAYY